jgi:hypothetical protein
MWLLDALDGQGGPVAVAAGAKGSTGVSPLKKPSTWRLKPY